MKIVLISSSTHPGQVRENGKSSPKSRTLTLLFPSLVTEQAERSEEGVLDMGKLSPPYRVAHILVNLGSVY